MFNKNIDSIRPKNRKNLVREHEIDESVSEFD